MMLLLILFFGALINGYSLGIAAAIAYYADPDSKVTLFILISSVLSLISGIIIFGKLLKSIKFSKLNGGISCLITAFASSFLFTQPLLELKKFLPVNIGLPAFGIGLISGIVIYFMCKNAYYNETTTSETETMGSKNYFNSYWKFSLLIPSNWRVSDGKNPEFYGPKRKSLKFAIGAISPFINYQEQQDNLVKIAYKYGHKVIEVNEIYLCGKSHATMICSIPSVGIVKNYSIIVKGIEYLITAQGDFTECDSIVNTLVLEAERNTDHPESRISDFDNHPFKQKPPQRYLYFREAQKNYDELLQKCNIDQIRVKLNDISSLNRYGISKEDPIFLKAMENYKTAIRLAIADNEWEDAVIAYSELGQIFYLVEDLEGAEDAFGEMVKIANNLPQPKSEINRIIGKGYIFTGILKLKKKHFIEAKKDIEQAIQISDNTVDDEIHTFATSLLEEMNKQS